MNVKLTVVDVDPSSKVDSAQGSVLCHFSLAIRAVSYASNYGFRMTSRDAARIV